MVFVDVRHAPNQKKTYRFRVPEELLGAHGGLFGDIELDDVVICDTSRGAQPGVVVGIVYSTETTTYHKSILGIQHTSKKRDPRDELNLDMEGLI